MKWTHIGGAPSWLDAMDTGIGGVAIWRPSRVPCSLRHWLRGTRSKYIPQQTPPLSLLACDYTIQADNMDVAQTSNRTKDYCEHVATSNQTQKHNQTIAIIMQIPEQANIKGMHNSIYLLVFGVLFNVHNYC